MIRQSPSSRRGATCRAAVGSCLPATVPRVEASTPTAHVTGSFSENWISHEHSMSIASGVTRLMRGEGGRPKGTGSRMAQRDGMGRTMRQGRVLLADSHLPMLQGVRSLLESLFAAVVMVADEGSLLETIERLDPDLVVVDLSMPVQ